MYNRYVRDEAGRYARVPQADPSPPPPPPPLVRPAPPVREPVRSDPPPPAAPPSILPDLRFFDRLLDKLDLDSGDLLLLLILFLLFRQEADEEVLIALGLLLIL